MRLCQFTLFTVAIHALILQKDLIKPPSSGHFSSISFEKGLLFFPETPKGSNLNHISKRYQKADQFESSSLDTCDSDENEENDEKIIDEFVENVKFFKFQLWACFQYTHDKTCHVRLKYLFDPVLERFERFPMEFREKSGLIKVMRSFSIIFNHLEKKRKRQCMGKFGLRIFCTKEEMLGSILSETKQPNALSKLT